MSQSIYERNLATLETFYPQLAARLKQFHLSGRTHWLQTSSQTKSLQFQLPDGSLIPLHHPQNPLAETQAWISKHQATIQTQPLLVLLGFGLGYQLLWMKQIIDPDTIIIIIEPELEFFHFGLHTVDCSDLWKNKNLIWCVSEPIESIRAILRDDRVSYRFTQTGLTLLGLPAQLHVHHHFLQSLTELIQEERRRAALRFRTNVSTTALSIHNITYNLPKVFQHGGIHPLHHRYAGFPAIVAAAGPSLAAALPTIQALQQNVVILAVDTAYPVLHHAGIEPLAVLAMDSTEENAQRLRGIGRSPATIVAYPGVHPDVVRPFEDRIVWYSLLCDPQRLPVSKFDEFIRLDTHLGSLLSFGSTTHVAISFARWLGCVPIFCAGMDLGYPGGSTYALGVQHVPQREGTELYVLSNAGEQIATNEAYQYFIEGFPALLQLTGADLFTTSLHGAAIPGVPFREISTVEFHSRLPLPKLMNKPLDRNTIFAIETQFHIGLMQLQTAIPRIKHLQKQWLNENDPTEFISAVAIDNIKQLKSLLVEFPVLESAIQLCPFGITDILSGQSLRQLRSQDPSTRAAGYQSIANFYLELSKIIDELHSTFNQMVEMCFKHLNNV